MQSGWYIAGTDSGCDLPTCPECGGEMELKDFNGPPYIDYEEETWECETCDVEETIRREP